MQGQEGERHVMQVCAYAAWRWLPALASLAQRTAAAGVVLHHVKDGAMPVWWPLLVWIRCLFLG